MTDVIVYQETVKNTTGREIVFWSLAGSERLSHCNMDEAIEDYLDIFALPGGGFADNMPYRAEFIGYARMKPHFLEKETLNHTLEYLDEEFGDPDGEWTEPTPEMIEAERIYHEAILKEYVPWMCEPVVRTLVNLQEWIKQKAKKNDNSNR